ncbi:hypothetical protein M404DRAFT_272571 [Pisolithus tinctorius Marx 270]|uniref:Uncharacterized protein n=1 Tax=Pisolithus tinctorius Marx 270 TaxID=870435 RepID=A0A0C3PLG5_PISTI|nr:hypothetical protein M404DRAFT_272571 [Pisolithus tinctorius Marx 270]
MLGYKIAARKQFPCFFKVLFESASSYSTMAAVHVSCGSLSPRTTPMTSPQRRPTQEYSLSAID